jgi:hypothetical protein
MSEVESSAPVQEQSQESTKVVESAPPATETEAKQAVVEAKTPEEKKEAVSQLRKFKLKIDGKEEEEEIDLSDEVELTKRLQLAKVAQRRMQDKAVLEKNLEQFIDLIRKDPAKVLSHPDIAVDLKEFAKKIISQDLQEQQKSPEQKEKERLEKELEDLRNKYETERKQKEQEEFQRLQSEQEEKLTTNIIGALESVQLPNSPRAVKYMAEYMAMALENGYDVTAEQVAPLVKQKMIEEYKELVRKAPDEILEQFIDKDIESRLQKKRLASIKKPVISVAKIPSVGEGGEPESRKVEKKRIGDWLNE